MRINNFASGIIIAGLVVSIATGTRGAFLPWYREIALRTEYVSGILNKEQETEPVWIEIPDEPVPAETQTQTAEPEETKRLFGRCTVTHFCNCEKCCGQWAGGATASGTTPTEGRTAASNCLPFGTEIEINGSRYIIEDRGDSNMNDFWIDIYVSSHEEALQRGMFSADVYIIDG